MVDGKEDRKEQFGFKMFQVRVEAMEVEGIESGLREIPIEEKGLVRGRDSVDVV